MGKKYMKENEKTEVKKHVLMITLILLIIFCASIVMGVMYYNEISKPVDLGDSSISNNMNDINNEESPVEEVPQPPKEVQIFKGEDRPIAVMIDTEKPAWPHAGLSDAYLLYEIIIEGGESRIMALFKGQDTEKIGPVRSSRHYFLDYVMENDAIYAHFGWSPLAQSDIKTYGINNINGIYDSYYWRVEPLSSYHNAFTSMENILKFANKKKYETTSTDKGVFTYSAETVKLYNPQVANTVKIKYSGLHNVTYTYNKENEVYERKMRGIDHKDRYTDEQYVAKNIVVCYVKNSLLNDPENKGRQELHNIGTGKGVYITNGEYIDITWKKQSREVKTKYYDMQGKEIVLNDGITWVQIVPVDNKIEIK